MKDVYLQTLSMTLLCVLAVSMILHYSSVEGSGDMGTGNASHIGDFSQNNPLEKILERAENQTNIEDRGRTYIFKKNGEVFHEYVEDHRDVHQGRMEQLLEAWQARKEAIEEDFQAMLNKTGGLNGSLSDLMDPDLDMEENYRNLIEDVKNEIGDETFHDPDLEATQSKGTVSRRKRMIGNNNDIMNGNSTSSSRRKRTMEKSDWRRWPKGIVPYVITEEVKENMHEYERAMGVYEEKTCIRFVPWVNASTNEDLGLGHPGFINFVKACGCWSYQGNLRFPDGQSISCCGGTACVHELGHALGSAHEHQSYLRDGWIRVNPENIWPDSRKWYNKFSDDSMLTFGYDLSSTMHYQTWGFSSGGPTMTVLFPELYIGDSDYYMFMEIAKTHKCEETEQCANFQLTCENDGYVSVVRGKCACRCPIGLDPETGCTTPIQVQSNLKMPSGQYALPRMKGGCPGDGDFKEGEATHYGDGWNWQGNPFSLDGEFSGTKATHAFCTRDEGTFETDPDFPETSDWPGGSYCILRKGGECPMKFLPSFIHYTDVESDEASQSGVIPDSTYAHNETRLEFCCQYNGFTSNPMIMPVDKPFALFAAGWDCQEIVGMHHRREEYRVDSVNVEYEGVIGIWHGQKDQSLYSYLCVYEPADMNCGGVITLDSSNLTTSIEMSSAGRTDLECTWVVKGDNQDGTIILEFDEFDIAGSGNDCVDKLEVRHSRIAQKGLIYCGQNDQQSIRSIYDKMMIKFSTFGSDSESHFKAYVRWIPNSELCYDVTDKGVTYDGKVDFTRKFEPCLPWAEVTQCPHHPWQQGDEQDNLEGNYCRNPDNSFRPWCYTSLSGCERNYCDVCSLEEAFDREENCDQLKEEGLCTDDVAQATHKCACTCNDLLPDPDTIQKFTDIRCGAPTSPIDGVPVGELKDEYALGEQVSFKCEGLSDVHTKTCLTSGDWTTLGFVCLECPLNSVVGGDFCYLLLNKQATFPNAQAECEKVGGSMVMPKSEEEHEAAMRAAQGIQVWLGLSDENTEGTFVWNDGTPVEFEKWNTDEPNDWGGYEDCAVMKGDGNWNDIYCYYSSIEIMCTVPKFTDVQCADFLETQCPQRLETRPSMCVDYPDFAEEFCAQTCGVCGAEGVTCPTAPESPDVEVESSGDVTINVGHYANYSCKAGTFYKSGSSVRACKSDGTLTGEDYVCKGPSESTIFIGLPTLEKQPLVIPQGVVLTGENGLWTITHRGVITAWEYYSNSPMQTAFMVWRVQEKEKKYKLIGKNVVQTANDDLERYDVPKGDQIQVEEGDVIAIWNAAEGGVHFRECDPVQNPGYDRVSWSRHIDNVEDLQVGNEESFNADAGCSAFAFKAEVALLE